ncbi:TPA: hypothetical protein ACHSON_002240 [Raoultella planticola ATCC 33531]
MDNIYEKSLEHAWKYFEIHSQQRVSIFNFFLGATGLVATGIGICIQQGGNFHYLSFALSVFLIFSSFIFWKLDQRTSMLIKSAEAALESLESVMDTPCSKLFKIDSANTDDLNKLFSPWTYGLCFRLTYIMAGALSVLSMIFSVVYLIIYTKVIILHLN